MTTTAIRVTEIPPLEHEEAMQVAAVQYERLIDALERLTAAQWAAPTECAGWDVRAVAGHLLGMMETFTDPAERVRQVTAAAQRMQSTGEHRIDALTAIQVEEHAGLTTAELVEALRAAAPRALAGRAALTADQRAQPYNPGPPFEGTWTVGYLADIIQTRDPWMHVVDVTRATRTELLLTPQHDGRIVADVVADWARRHGQPFTLVLTGPAGGTYVGGEGRAGDAHELDAVEFCRILSGRAPGSGILAHQIPF